MESNLPDTAHPSFLELDQLAVGDQAVRASTRQHLESCQVCSAHLAAVRVALPVPDWAQQRAPTKRWTWGLRLPLLAATCAVAVLGGTAAYRVAQRHAATDAYQEKSAGPGLRLFIKRGADVHAWDGREVLVPGDLLRLQVAAEGFRHVLVRSPSSKKPLFEGDVSSAIGFLPVSWRVDDQPGPEQLDITLSAPGVRDWHRQLVLPKSGI